MITRTVAVAVAVAVAIAVVLAACGGVEQACACSTDRFRGAEGLTIVDAGSEPQWWADPVVVQAAPTVTEARFPGDTLYATGVSTLSPEAAASLDAAFGHLDPSTVTTVEIHCHADNTGDPASNAALSTSRAQGVAEWFMVGGRAGRDQITAEGHGDTQPIDTNDTPTGRAKNRRCHVTVTTVTPAA